MSEFSINNPNGYLAGPLGSFRVYGADGRLKAIGAGGGGGATWGTITGDILNQTDLIDYIASQTGGGFVPESRTLTINGETYDLSENRSWTLPTGGTVTDVTGTGTVSGLTLTGSGTDSVTLTLGGSLVLVASDITTALGYTPYSDTNPAGFITQTTADGRYYPLTANPSNYVTSSTLTTVLSNYLTTSDASSTYLTIVDAGFTYQPIFTTQNGLTYGAGVLKLGGELTEATTITGINSHSLDFTDLASSTNTAKKSYSFATSFGGNNTLLSLDSDNNISTFSHEDAASGDISAIELLGTELRVKTPDYTTATNGDVLTLLDNTTGAAEWQTPTGGAGGILHGTAAGTDTYTVTITGATAYADGDAYLIRFTNGNTTSATLDINGFGAVDLYRNNDGALIGGDIVDGGEMLCIYNSTTNRFQVIGTAPNTLLGYVTNGESITITKGQAVYAFSGTGDRMVVKLANNTGDATSAQTVGLVLSTSIGANQKGLIMLQGLLDGLSILPDTTWDDGDPVYLDATAGGITKTKPYAPNHLVYLGVVTTASNGNSGRMYVKVQNGYELDELHNVQAQSPTVNDVLYYFGGTPGQWKTASLSTILGYTPVPTTRTLTINGNTQDLSVDRSWTVTAASGDLPEISVSTSNAREDNYAPTGWPGTSDIVKVIRINSTNTDYMMCLGGLASPTAGRIVTIYNSSTANNLIIIENLSTSSTAANRFRMTANLPYFLLPNRSVTFLYDGTYWTQFSASNSGGFDFFDDCTGGGSGYVTTSTVGMSGVHASGTSAGVRSGNFGASDGFGEYGLQTGTSTTGFASVSTQTRRAGGNNAFGAYIGTSDVPYITVSKIALSALATVAQDYRAHFGMNGASSLPANAPTIGYLWSYEGTANSAWTARTQNTGGTTSTVTTGLTASAAYVWLGVYKPGGSTIRDAVYFYSSNGIIYQMASKFVGVTGTYGGSPTVVIGSIAGTTAKELIVDWIGTSFNLAR
jgi:hypothetical protein